jgi:hypothetical protein
MAMEKYREKECKTHGLTTHTLTKTGYKSKSGIPSFKYKCRKCDNEFQLRYSRRLKQKCVDYKGGKCEKCGYNKSLNSLHFHHLDPSIKEFGMSRKRKNWEALKAELDKCILVCANCHGELHEKEVFVA